LTKVQTTAWIAAAGVLVGVLAAGRIADVGAPNVQRAQELSGTVTRLEQENAALAGRMEELNSQIRRYEASVHDDDRIEAEIAASLEAARMEAGLLALKGPGIVVEVDDLRAEGSIVRFVQDEDLLAIVNELNAAGAEAISINGERLISISEIRLAGNHININTRAQSAPFVVSAIGNPDTLLAAMNLYGGVVDTFSQIAVIRAYPAEEVEIPTYRGAPGFLWARAAD